MVQLHQAGIGQQQSGAVQPRTSQSSIPREPMHPAPARFGQAGLSAGDGRHIKEHISDDGGWVRPEPVALAEALGWFSIALGALEFVAADRLARSLGMENKSALIRLYGLREIGQGIGLLVQDSPPGYGRWLRIRAAGDVLDLATLAPGLSRNNPQRTNVMLAMGAVGGVMLLDTLAAALCAER
jgi:hypothetical protein